MWPSMPFPLNKNTKLSESSKLNNKKKKKKKKNNIVVQKTFPSVWFVCFF